jgi:hypothetical protein
MLDSDSKKSALLSLCSYAKDVASEKLGEAKDYLYDTKDYLYDTKEHVTGEVKERDAGKWWTWALWGKQAREKREAAKYGQVRCGPERKTLDNGFELQFGA